MGKQVEPTMGKLLGLELYSASNPTGLAVSRVTCRKASDRSCAGARWRRSPTRADPSSRNLVAVPLGRRGMCVALIPVMADYNKDKNKPQTQTPDTIREQGDRKDTQATVGNDQLDIDVGDEKTATRSPQQGAGKPAMKPTNNKA
jgi:hypothetical protein